jgi:glycosyltransferase involved in cell wall biosynthesis
MTSPVETVVLQNYFTPYRHALFEAVGRERGHLTVVYSGRPERDRRRWLVLDPREYRAVHASSVRIGPLVLFSLPVGMLKRARDTLFILHDDNPANLAMIAWALLLRLAGARALLWSEHIPDPGKGIKRAYQRASSHLLTRLVTATIAFSELTESYVRNIAPRATIYRMVQSVPQPFRPVPLRGGPIRRFGFIGSTQSRKNLAALLASVLAVPDIELHVAGVPATLEHPRIKWWGYVSGEEREAFYSSIDMLVLPSLKEPWGLVVNEALDRGALAMVSTASGSRELVEAIDPALVFEPSPEGIASALQYWAGRDATELRARVDDVIESYSTASAAARFVAIIDAARR